jgi:hypothetical protein
MPKACLSRAFAVKAHNVPTSKRVLTSAPAVRLERLIPQAAPIKAGVVQRQCSLTDGVMNLV